MNSSIRVDETARGKVWSRLVTLEDADSSFDLAFWQAQSTEARFSAAWDLVQTAWELKNRPSDELRLQRTTGRFVPCPS